MRINGKRIIFFAATLSLSGIVLISCISRDNEYDPINYLSVLQQRVRDTTLSRLDSNFMDLSSALRSLDSLKNRLIADSLYNNSLRHTNDSLRAANLRLRTRNDSVAVANNAVPAPQVLGKKTYLDTLYLMLVRDTTGQLVSLSSLITRAKQRADSLMIDANRRYSPTVIFSPSQSAAILGRYDSLTGVVASCKIREVGHFTVSTRANRDTIIPYNTLIKQDNTGIKAYNDSIAFRGFIRVSKPDSIISRLSNAVPGDRFLIPIGTVDLSGPIRFQNSGTITQPIIVQGQGQGDTNTRFNLSNVVLDSNSYITFNSISFTGSSVQSVLVRNGCIGIRFNSCQFRDNTGKGLFVISSEVTLTDCRVVGNGGPGIAISCLPGRPHLVVLNNVLIASNGGIALIDTGCNLTVQNTTIVNHNLQAIYLVDPAMDLMVTNSLITNNGGNSSTPVIYFANGFAGGTQLSIINTNIALDSKGKDTVNAPITSTLLHYDPMYLSSRPGDYVPSPASKLDTLEKAGVIIGYRKR